MRKRILARVGALALCAPVLVAQQSKPSTPPTVTSILDRALSNVEREFVSAAEAMPDDKFDFAPTNGEFKGVRTFAQQIKHVAATNCLIAASILEEKPPAAAAEGENGPAAMKGKADIVKYLKDSLEYTHKAFATVNEKNLTAEIATPSVRAK